MSCNTPRNRFFRPVLSAAMLACAMLAIPGFAQEQPPTGSDQARFDADVRGALLRNPETILEVLELLEQQEQDAQDVQDRQLVASLADDLFAPADPAGPVLVEFLDYNCGFCRRAEPEVERLLADAPQTRLVLLQMPVLGEGSVEAAQVALTLRAQKGEEAYRAFSQKMIAARGNVSFATAMRVAEELGHDPEEIREGIAAKIYSPEMQRMQRLARELEVRGTPFFAGPGGIIRGYAEADRLAELTISAEQNDG